MYLQYVVEFYYSRIKWEAVCGDFNTIQQSQWLECDVEPGLVKLVIRWMMSGDH